MQERNENGYLIDDTLLEVTLTKNGNRGVMPAWLAEVSREAGIVTIDNYDFEDFPDIMRTIHLSTGTGE